MTSSRFPSEDKVLFFRVVRAAFSKRRKTLVNALDGAFAGLDKAALRDITGRLRIRADGPRRNAGYTRISALSRAVGMRLDGGAP